MKSAGMLALGCTVVVVCLPAFAAEQSARDGAVTSALTATKIVVQADGKEARQSAQTANPGDLLEYSVVYRNTGSVAVHNLAATLPVPTTGVEFVAGSGSPTVTSASLDGKSFLPVPLMRKVTLADGRTEMRAVPTAEYRFLRWQVGDLPAGGSATVSARMRVGNVAAPIAIVAK